MEFFKHVEESKSNKELDEEYLWKKVKEVEIKTSKLVNQLFGGEYRSAFKGRGLDFKELKEYEQGDDPRHIDWRVSIKRGAIHVKRFTEERELSIIIAIDVSNSTLFGSNNQLKREMAVEFCASIAFSGMKNNDRIGLILFSDKILEFIPPQKGKKNTIKIIKTIISYTYNYHDSTNTDINSVLLLINKFFKKKITAFIVSDFCTNDFQNSLKIVSNRHDIINVMINDPIETNMPDVGLVEFQDPETKKRYLIDTSDKKVMKKFKDSILEKRENLYQLFSKNKSDKIILETDKSFVIPLNNFFKLREKSFR
jgi:uncharacterized protein (DUF58 family)